MILTISIDRQTFLWEANKSYFNGFSRETKSIKCVSKLSRSNTLSTQFGILVF